MSQGIYNPRLQEMLEAAEGHKVRHYIAGAFVDQPDEAWLDNRNPATGHFTGRIARGDARTVEQAVAAAWDAAPGWAATSPAERSAWLLRIADAIEARSAALAQLESQDTGKPLALARSMDIPRAVLNFRFFAGALLHEQDAAYAQPGALTYTRQVPVGVCALISPWNLPLYLLTWKIAPCLAWGNCAIAKPSELTPLTAHALAEIVHELGLPPGVLNIIHGLGPEVGQALIDHPRIPAISFTGGTATGRLVARAAAERFAKTSLELGGKNPNLVFADCDFEAALEGSLRAAFTNQGQICLCGSRIFVERALYERFLTAFIDRTRAIVVGDPSDPNTNCGPLISAAHRDKVLRYLAVAREEGGTVQCGGEIPAVPDEFREGFFLTPAVITGLDPQSRVMQEEVFGPVVTITPFDTEAEAIALANGTPYGLSASLWTRDLERAHRTAAALQAGTVWINTWLLRDLRAPFGGVKASGLGREGGHASREFFTEAQTVCVKVGGQ